MEKRNRYINRLFIAREAPPIKLVYQDGREELFAGPLPQLIDRLKIEMVFDGAKFPWTSPAGHRDHAREPGFFIEPRIQFGSYAPVGFITVFTKTSKMRCPSFSLPVGPSDMGGTCLVAGQRALVEDDDLFICHGCYASDGNYRMSSTQLTAGVRRIVVIRALKRGSFVDAMVEAIRAYRAKPRHDDLKAKVDGKSRKVGTYQLDTHYVRIHDAGDVLWQPGYREAWTDIASRVRDVLFWMPTRDWALGRNAIRRLTSTRANLVVRPSALHVGDPAPEVEGLDAGTSVAFDAVEQGLAEVNCPAYDQKKDKSCQTARCRRCWTQPTKTINYEPHGREMTRKKLAAAIARRNPPASLEDIYDAYLGDPTSNPADDTGFEVWMARNDLYAADWSQAEWWSLLHEIGLDGDETAEYLENTAEWRP